MWQAIQLAPTGVFQFWDAGAAVTPVYEVAVADIYTANAAAGGADLESFQFSGGSLVRENKVYITPAARL